jgi:fucose 4-O-acetylase-like acetyltransferase
LAPPPEFFHQLGALKGGYWFTFVLFEYFILYIVIERAGRIWSPILAIAITLASFFYARYYDSLHSSAEGYKLLIIIFFGFLSVTAWRLFIFFYIGAWMRRHVDAFIRWTSKPAIILIITVVFFLIASTPHKDNLWFEMFRYYAGGITGMWMVFTIFRLSASWLNKSGLEKPMQYVGTRTLDIYLLHYFFLPRFLMEYALQLQTYDSRLLEFIVIMALSLVILVLCLITSYVIRLSPFLGHYLFGAKY